MVTVETDRPSSRQRLLDATVELLRTKGPTASGTLEILALADAPRGSFYHHFPNGKEQLVAEAIGLTAAATEGAIAVALADRSVPLPRRVERMFTAVADALVIDDYRLGCGVAATVLDSSATSPSLRATTEAAFATWTSTLVAGLADAGIESEAAITLADTIVAGLEGATMLARARRDAAPLRHVAVAMAALVAAEVPGLSSATGTTQRGPS